MSNGVSIDLFNGLLINLFILTLPKYCIKNQKQFSSGNGQEARTYQAFLVITDRLVQPHYQ